MPRCDNTLAAVFCSKKLIFDYLIQPTRENPGFSAVLFLGLPVADPEAVRELGLRFVLIASGCNNLLKRRKINKRFTRGSRKSAGSSNTGVTRKSSTQSFSPWHHCATTDSTFYQQKSFSCESRANKVFFFTEMPADKYSILLPTYNERQNLPIIVWLLVKYLDERWELLKFSIPATKANSSLCDVSAK